MCSSVALSAFLLFSSRPYYPSQEFLHLLKLKLLSQDFKQSCKVFQFQWKLAWSVWSQWEVSVGVVKAEEGLWAAKIVVRESCIEASVQEALSLNLCSYMLCNSNLPGFYIFRHCLWGCWRGIAVSRQMAGNHRKTQLYVQPEVVVWGCASWPQSTPKISRWQITDYTQGGG